MTEVEKAILAAQRFSAIEQSVMKVAATYNRHTEIGDYLRTLWLAIAGITHPLDYTEGREAKWLKDAERKLISSLKGGDLDD